MAENKRKALIPLTVALVAGAVAVGSGATWTSQSSNTVSVTGGSLVHVNDQDGLTLTLTDIKPGDSMVGTVSVTNTGNIDSTLDFTSGVVTSGFASGMLTLLVEVDPDGPGAAGWSTLSTGDIALTSVSETGTVFNVGDVRHYRFTVALDPTSANVDQGKAADLTFTFDQTQVAGESLIESWL